MPHPRVIPRCDVVLYGATGFVGRQVAAYFALHAPRLRWAVAGRSATRLQAVLSGCGAAGAGLIVADATDAAALDALAAQTRVVLSTAGPFALYGSELVAACVRHGTHYVDITGETPWVREMIDRHHDAAASRGTRIVPGCGFDSVPSDMGACLVAQALQRRHGERFVDVKACFSLRGVLNGGTVASLL
ncbi:MAG TPA: saccharopine dehydrogenase NADP-binding domain-containing protein, partial [Rubrivivax sp.]|nr:saccharopine dehydrogenase NADP-binding domain-containing protein [Rubrivivax sp.]